QRHEPRYAGRRHPDVRSEITLEQPQRTHVLDRLQVGLPQVGRRGPKRRAGVHPALVAFGLRAPAAPVRPQARSWGADQAVGLQPHLAGHPPAGADAELDRESDTAVRERWSRIAADDPVDEAAVEVVVLVGGYQLGQVRAPDRLEPLALAPGADLDLE